jgi:hypothetical protein
MGALPNVKITMFFDDGVQGWSETHYTAETSIGSATNSYQLMLALVNARILLVDGTNVTFLKARTSVDNISRDRQLLLQKDVPTKLPGKGYQGGINAGTVPWAWQSPHVSWVVDMDTEVDGVNPTQYLAGMPANTGQIGNNAYTATAPSPGTLMEAYYSLLVNGSYGCAYRKWPSNPPTIATSTLLGSITWAGASGAMPNNFTFAVGAPAVLPVVPAGTYVRLWGATYTSVLKRIRLNGTYKVISSTTTAMVVACPRVTVAPTWGIPGYVQVATFDYTPYTGYTIGTLTHRKRGRPTSAARGRR